MQFLDLGLFLTVTLGHLALVPYWLRLFCGDRPSDGEAVLFSSITLGFGSLQAVLQILACTVGLSLVGGIVSLSVLHAVVWVCRPGGWVFAERARGRPAVERRASAAAVGRALLSASVALIGAGAVVACVLTWLWRASQSLQILGIDSIHYHAPYAINYAHGVSPFGFAATPHLYPMGTSLLAAWFFQPLASPLLLDLTSLLPFLLLFASLAYLFTLLTDDAAMDWVPVVFLLLFTGRVFRVSVFISADLFYAAAFAALFAQLCAIWIDERIDIHEWLALGASIGLLLASKIQGLVSVALLLGLFVVALLGRRVLTGSRLPRAPSAPVAISALCLLIAAGGIWQIRSWVLFGSPMAPAGLSLFGVTIFPGEAGRSANAPLSIVADMHNTPGYHLWQRFRFYTWDWVGGWPWLLSVGGLTLLADAAYQLATARRLRVRTAHQLFALLFFALLCAIHMYVLIGVPFSSLEWLHGQPLRYILPFFALYGVIMLATFFRDSLPWVQARWTKWLVLPVLLYLLADYNRLTLMPPQWNRMHGVENMLDYRLLPVALIIVLPAFLHAAPWRRYAGYVSAVALAAYCAVVVGRSVTQAQQLGAQAAVQFERQLSRFQRDGGAPTEYRGVLFRTVLYQRQQHLRCARSRFFTISRFDFPVELQDPGFNNLVFDVQEQATRIASLLQSDGPGHERCDFIVAVHTTAVDQGATYPAVGAADISRLLSPRGTLQAIGDSGRYRVYYVRG